MERRQMFCSRVEQIEACCGPVISRLSTMSVAWEGPDHVPNLGPSWSRDGGAPPTTHTLFPPAVCFLVPASPPFLSHHLPINSLTRPLNEHSPSKVVLLIFSCSSSLLSGGLISLGYSLLMANALGSVLGPFLSSVCTLSHLLLASFP